MKKLLSIALTVVMMMAICVPAFAAASEITVDQTATTPVDTEVVVSTLTTTNGQDAYYYTVTIPADFSIEWNDDAVKTNEVAYTVESQLLIGASLKISVAANNGGVMNLASDPTSEYKLTYTLENGAAVTFPEVNGKKVDGALTGIKPSELVTPAADPTIQIKSFAGVPVAEYTGTLTYTVEYVAPTTV